MGGGDKQEGEKGREPHRLILARRTGACLVALDWNQMTVDERIEALTMSLELLHRDVQDLKAIAQQDGENIRALARIAEIHERRLTELEGGE